MSDPVERDAFGGHTPALKAIREHRAWHDESGRSEVCSLRTRSRKEAEYVRFLLATVDGEQDHGERKV